MYTPKGRHYFSQKTQLKLLRSHYKYCFCITNASPKQPNAPEGLYTNAIRQGAMAYIALPYIAW